MRWTASITLAACLGIVAVTSALGQSTYWLQNSNLEKGETLRETMRHAGARELPVEALALYEAGRHAQKAGDKAQARVYFEQATVLDPSFPDAYWALAGIDIFSRPQSVPNHIRDAVVAAVATFPSQHLTLINTVFAVLLITGMVALLVVLLSLTQLLPRVHHVIGELLSRNMPRAVAFFGAWMLLATPFLWRLGVLPALLLLAGLVWPIMKTEQRRWTMGLVGMTALVPVLMWGFSPLLFSPLDPQSNTSLISRAMVSGNNPGLLRDLTRATQEQPENASLLFARAITEKRAGDFSGATRDFKKALDLGGPEAAIENNLGVIAYHQGRFDDAITHFKSAVAANQKQSAAHYNLSQAYAKKLYFEKADEELAAANRLAFKRVRYFIKNQTGGKNDTLLDEPLSASVFWAEAWSAPRLMPGLPGWFRFVVRGKLMLMPVIILPLFVFGFVAGTRLHRILPSFACQNCRRPVSRKVLRRIRKQAYCIRCGDMLLQIQSAAYSQLALASQLKRANRFGLMASRILAWVVPGYHAIRIGRPGIASLICGFIALSLTLGVKGIVAVTRIPWLSQEPGAWWPALPILIGVLAIVTSWITVVRMEEEEEEEPTEDEFEDPEEPLLPNVQAA